MTARVAALTGATSESGRALARAYADAGWDVALLGRGWAALEAAAADVRARGSQALVVPIDVTDDAARQLAIHRIQDELGPIEAWVAEGLVPRLPARPLRMPRPSRRRAFARRAGELLAPVEAMLPPPRVVAPAAALAGVVVLGVVVGARGRRD